MADITMIEIKAKEIINPKEFFINETQLREFYSMGATENDFDYGIQECVNCEAFEYAAILRDMKAAYFPI